MKKLIALSTALALGLTVAACDGPKENAAEDVGEMQEEAVDDQADAMEDTGAISDTQEEAMTDKAEDKADAMEEAGEDADQADGTTADPT